MTTTIAPTYISSPQVCEIAGCSFRQLDYWANKYRITPGEGSGNHRFWTEADTVRIVVVAEIASCAHRTRWDVGLATQLSDIAEPWPEVLELGESSYVTLSVKVSEIAARVRAEWPTP